MNLSAKTSKSQDQKARLALRSSKWKNALPFFEEQAHSDEQNFAQWNMLGDIQFRSGDLHGASASWQKALDGFAQESLHENVLGIGRKMIKRCPEETGVHRAISEAYFGIEYFADAISCFRSYVKLSKHATDVEKKAWFRKAMTYEIKQPHLLEELVHLHDECNLEDIELQRELASYVERMHESTDQKEVEEADEVVLEPHEEEIRDTYVPSTDGLVTIETDWSDNSMTFIKNDAPAFLTPDSSYDPTAMPAHMEVPSEYSEEDLPNGQGKDHYDLGVVYAEMKLWDAAITEFQTARRDRSIRSKATIELAQCYKNSNDPHRALRLLEEETNSTDSEADIQNDLNYHMGILNELLGNKDMAKSCFAKVGADSAHSAEAVRRAAQLSA
jgi:tetratricopeptide (TPR) repeat protein